jgi:NADH-quinone oxidoreductase subunit J
VITSIIFYTLAAVIAVFSVLAVTSQRLIRSATFLLFVLLGAAGLYVLLGYYYLFAVQTVVYAGGIMVLFIFAILLTHKPSEKIAKEPLKKRFLALFLSFVGIAFCGGIIVSSVKRISLLASSESLSPQALGLTLMGTDKYQYLLPFELISVLLLACIVGAIMIARKR